jgi:hypothetical protein
VEGANDAMMVRKVASDCKGIIVAFDAGNALAVLSTPRVKYL